MACWGGLLSKKPVVKAPVVTSVNCPQLPQWCNPEFENDNISYRSNDKVSFAYNETLTAEENAIEFFSMPIGYWSNRSVFVIFDNCTSKPNSAIEDKIFKDHVYLITEGELIHDVMSKYNGSSFNFLFDYLDGYSIYSNIEVSVINRICCMIMASRFNLKTKLAPTVEINSAWLGREIIDDDMVSVSSVDTFSYWTRSKDSEF